MEDDDLMADAPLSGAAVSRPTADDDDGSIDQDGIADPVSLTRQELRIHHGGQVASTSDIYASTAGENYRAWETFVDKTTYVRPLDELPAAVDVRPVDLLTGFPQSKCHPVLYSKLIQVLDKKATPKSNPPPGLDPLFSEWVVFVSSEKNAFTKKSTAYNSNKRQPKITNTFHFPYDLSPAQMQLIETTVRDLCEHCE
ncbi:hypothetical protein LTR97_003782 [Elasticomyces elasticus]|uniref:Uncharacterized protein n=1 Tax=Elasticomyces elasticus TaxID=574655 RepID=A0AAN7W9I9_9PEZI|nr:hypothetical protein LTR97_003782 [Elasticomyces elasticus]